MSFEISGKLVAKFNIVQRTESFKTREFVIEKSEDIGGRIITNYVKFQCVQDKTAMPDRFNLGDEVKVQFNIKGTKWVKDGKENYITNLDAWRMEQVNFGQQQSAPQTTNQAAPANYNQGNSYSQSNNSFSAGSENVDDLPF